MKKLTKSFLILFFFLLTVAYGLSTVSFAAIPRTLNFQAKLTDKNGAPLNGSYQIKLELYNALTGGTALWQETQTAAVQDGIANLILGSVTALNLSFDRPYWLAITIGTETLPERQPISSSAYSLNAERLGGIASTNILASDAGGNVTLKGSLATSNRNYVGMEYNILFNGDNRYAVSQTGPAAFNLAVLFDGKLAPSYPTNGPSIANPQVILIENLPATHTQAAAWVGWTTRYWPPAKFKIEGFDAYNNANVWRVLADYSTTAYTGSDFLVKISPGGSYTKLKFTVYEGIGTLDASGAKRVGLSELFFIHPEANRPYSGLLPSTMWESKDGKVGIGTATPDAKLHIAAALNNWTSNAWRKGLRLDDINAIEFGGGATTKYGIGQSGNKLYFFDTTVEDNTAPANYRMTLSAGNVGIGTMTPTQKLEVYGNIWVRGGSNLIIDSPNTTGGWARGMMYYPPNQSSGTELGGIGLIGTGSTLARMYLTLGNDPWNSTAGLQILANGNVGLGTMTPAARLHVKGDAVIEGSYLKIPVVATDPASPQDGMIWYNSAEASFKCRQAGVTKKFAMQ